MKTRTITLVILILMGHIAMEVTASRNLEKKYRQMARSHTDEDVEDAEAEDEAIHPGDSVEDNFYYTVEKAPQGHHKLYNQKDRHLQIETPNHKYRHHHKHHHGRHQDNSDEDEHGNVHVQFQPINWGKKLKSFGMSAMKGAAKCGMGALMGGGPGGMGRCMMKNAMSSPNLFARGMTNRIMPQMQRQFSMQQGMMNPMQQQNMMGPYGQQPMNPMGMQQGMMNPMQQQGMMNPDMQQQGMMNPDMQQQGMDPYGQQQMNPNMQQGMMNQGMQQQNMMGQQMDPNMGMMNPNMQQQQQGMNQFGQQMDPNLMQGSMMQGNMMQGNMMQPQMNMMPMQ